MPPLAFARRFGPEAPALVKFDIADMWIAETPDGAVHCKQKHTQTCIATGKSVTQVFYQEWVFDDSGLSKGCNITMGNPAGVDAIFEA